MVQTLQGLDVDEETWAAPYQHYRVHMIMTISLSFHSAEAVASLVDHEGGGSKLAEINGIALGQVRVYENWRGSSTSQRDTGGCNMGKAFLDKPAHPEP